ncbi:hypothetical protein [Thalassolituus oleivorans]|uniref:hypothetical protein n=1 Tax=Thalassolituus oleivorans TaxID=187493 RepID=UPI0023F30722|nr:hypothetical protein [Thalassolituus oleivorans]
MKNKIAYLKKVARENALRSGALVVGTLAGTSAFAIDATPVTAAFDEANATYGVAVTALIALVAIGVGVGMIVSMMRKG